MTLILSVAITAYLAIGIIYFGIRIKKHSQLRDTISELGEFGAPLSGQVNKGLFLPVGIGCFLVTALSLGSGPLFGLSFCLGTGYILAAFFPCDPGSPFQGSTRQQIHNIGGFIEYAGGVYFLSKAADEFGQQSIWDYKTAAVIMFFVIILISMPKMPIRGLVQRIGEAVLFGSMIMLSMGHA